MITWKLLIEYDGTKYSGWQDQKNARTVAGEIRKAAEEFFGRGIEIMGSGRTDAGVHALGQVAHLRCDVRSAPPPDTLVRMLNSRMPADIAILAAERVPNNFHARHDAVSRSYLYQIATRKTAFSKRYVWWIKEDLDEEAMAEAAALLPGRHDFVNFRAADSARRDESTIVVVERASIAREDYLLVFRIEASHFLWRMVRRVAGVLVKVGLHEVSVDQFAALLSGESQPKLDVAAWTAPASGLFLENVYYPDPKEVRR